MAKSLQEQLLSSGLVDKKKAKKAAKEMKMQDHLQRTGQENKIDEAKAKADQALREKTERDRQLNLKREEEAQAKAITAQIKQLVKTNSINSERGDIKYQFVDGKKVKFIYVDQAVFDRLSRGQLAIISLEEFGARSYQVIPLQIADKIKQRKDGYFIYIAEKTQELAEDDPYAAYAIPDDLMW